MRETRAYAAWSALLLITFTLLTVWQIPGTIGLRNTLAALLIVVMTATWAFALKNPTLCICNQRGGKGSVGSAPLILLGSLTLWIVIVIYYWSSNPVLSWHEFRGQWLAALVAGACGMGLASIARQRGTSYVNALVLTVFWGLLIQVVLHDILGAIYWWSTGNAPFRQASVLYLPEVIRAIWHGQNIWESFNGTSPDKFSYVNNTLAALLVAEIIQRLLSGKRWIPCSNLMIGFAVVSMVLCSYWLQMRNGNVGLLLLLLFAVLMVTLRVLNRHGVHKVILVFGLVLSLLGGVGFAMIKSDPRWEKLGETVPIALDTKTYHRWLTKTGAYPEIKQGIPVDISAYERLAWGKEGVTLIMEHPLGVGYNRNAYGDTIERKYPNAGPNQGSHSHSGIIDFAIANGIPGLALWISFLATLFWIGWEAFQGRRIANGLALMFLVSGFMTRSIVDSNIRDHILQQFLFLAALLVVLAKCQPEPVDQEYDFR